MQKLSIVKRVLHSDAFKIYFWPIFVCYLFISICLSLFLPLEPGSLREAIFVSLGGGIWILCLWILIVRYQRVKDKSVGKRTIVLLIIVSATHLLYLVHTVIAFLIIS